MRNYLHTICVMCILYEIVLRIVISYVATRAQPDKLLFCENKPERLLPAIWKFPKEGNYRILVIKKNYKNKS